MKTSLYFFYVLLAFWAGCNVDPGQKLTPTLIEEINKRSALMSVAMVTRDYASIAELTDPKIIEILGGKQALIEHLRKMFEPSNATAFQIHSMKFADPTDAKLVGNKLLAVVPYEGIIESSSKTVFVQHCFIAARDSSGGDWYFVDGRGADKGKLHAAFPKYDSQLKIPEYKVEEIGMKN